MHVLEYCPRISSSSTMWWFSIQDAPHEGLVVYRPAAPTIETKRSVIVTTKRDRSGATMKDIHVLYAIPRCAYHHRPKWISWASVVEDRVSSSISNRHPCTITCTQTNHHLFPLSHEKSDESQCDSQVARTVERQTTRTTSKRSGQAKTGKSEIAKKEKC